MLIDQYPGAQLGQEPQLLSWSKPATSILRSFPRQHRDDFAAGRRDVTAFLFRDENHVIKGLADPKVFEALRP